MYKSLCLLILLFRCLDTKILKGHLLTTENWAFVARFCFLSDKGKFRFELTLEQDKQLELLLYYDAHNVWQSVYPSDKTCEERKEVLKEEDGQIIKLTTDVRYAFAAGCKLTQMQPGSKTQMIFCNSSREFQSSRPLWWFIVLADCTSRTGLNVSYWMSLRNAKEGSFWREHFSADEFFILPLLIVVAIAYVVLLGWSYIIARELCCRKLYHNTYKLFNLSVGWQFAGVLFEAFSFFYRGFQGTKWTKTDCAGNLLQCLAESIFTYLLLLLSLGYSVTKSVLSQEQRRWLYSYMAVDLTLTFCLFVYQVAVFDPGLVLYLYESPPGYCLIALQMLTWIIFSSCCIDSCKKTKGKFQFYASLLSLGSAWFLCRPMTVLTITILVDPWVRESIAKGASLWIIFIGHSLFLFLTRPSLANQLFPFHIRTCQVMPVVGDQNHSYEPKTRAASSLYTMTQTRVPLRIENLPNSHQQ